MPLNALAWLRTNRAARFCDSPSLTGAFQALDWVKLVGWTKKIEARGAALPRVTPVGSQSAGLFAMSGRAIHKF